MTEKKTYCFTGLTTENNFSVYNNSLATVVRAVKERVFFVKSEGKYSSPFRPTKDSFFNELTTVFQLFKRHSQYTTPMQAAEFCESYQGRRREVYMKAHEENQEYGFDDKFATIRPFVKVEKYNFTKKIDPVPRIIQPRDPRYIVETGRYIKPIEKKIYNIINHIFGDITVYKGMNAEQRGKAISNTWNSYSDPVAIGLDAHRFDQHVSNAALNWEHAVYQLFYPSDQHFRRLMGLQRSNRASSYIKDSGIRYKTIHNRMSGDSNTSLGNVTLMCSMVFRYIETLHVRVSLVNDGDDCVLIFDKRHLNKVSSGLHPFFAKLGFTLTVEDPVYDLEKIEFCQSHPVMDNNGEYIMVRDPNVALAKDCVALKPLDNEIVKQRWLSAVGAGGMALTAGLPICQEFYDVFLRASKNAKPLSDPTLEGGFERLSRGMSRQPQPVTAKTRYSFWLAFDIPPESQRAIEEYYRGMEMTIGDINNRFVPLPFSTA